MKRGLVAVIVVVLGAMSLSAVGEKVLTVGTPRNPFSSQYATPGVEPYITGIYETLVFVSPEMTIEPGLAKSWERLDDLTWRYHLRQGVLYHNGKPFNAATAKYSVEWILGKILWSDLLNIGEVRIVDDYTIDIATVSPSAVAPDLLSYGWVVMSEPESQAAQQVVGTGPFMYESAVAGEKLVVKKNPNYWEPGKPLIDRIVFKVIPDETSRVLALMGGEVDIALQVPYPSIASVEAAGFKTYRVLNSNWSAISFSVTASPVDDVRVRKAIAHGIDREAIVDSLLYGQGLVGNSPILPTIPWSGEALLEGIPHDPARARALLDEAGWVAGPGGKRAKGGQPLAIVIRLIDDPSVVPAGRESAQVIAAQLGDLGFDVRISVEQEDVYFDQSAATKAGHLYIDNVGAFSGDVTSLLYFKFQPNREVYSESVVVYGDHLPPVVGDWVLAIQNTTNKQERESYVVKITNLVDRDMVLTIPFLYYYTLTASSAKVIGYVPNPLFFWQGVWTSVDVK